MHPKIPILKVSPAHSYGSPFRWSLEPQHGWNSLEQLLGEQAAVNKCLIR